MEDINKMIYKQELKLKQSVYKDLLNRMKTEINENFEALNKRVLEIERKQQHNIRQNV